MFRASALALRCFHGEPAPLTSRHFDLIVLGSGPAGQKCAIAAAKLRKKVAIIDKGNCLGGVCTHTGTLPSKTMREAIMYFSGHKLHSFYGKAFTPKADFHVSDLTFRVDRVVESEAQIVANQLKRNNVTVFPGLGRFEGQHTVVVDDTYRLTAEKFMIAVGTRPSHRPEIVCDGKKIFDSDQILCRDLEPFKDLIVVGAGVIGIEYASMFSALPGVRATVIDGREKLLPFIDRELVHGLYHYMRSKGSSFRMGEKVEGVTYVDEGRKVCASLASGKKIYGDALLYAVGRQANTDSLGLELAGIPVEQRGKIAVNDCFQTQVPHIYAAGDVIGVPALASSSFEQGRLAALHMFGDNRPFPIEKFPYGIYTIPEISMVGKTEFEMTSQNIPFESGIARFEELAKGQMIGDRHGILKLLFDPTTLKLLGVHVFGDSAAELVHIGQAVLSYGGDITYFRDTVFNYPTHAEAYKVAALDGINKCWKPDCHGPFSEPLSAPEE